MCLKPDQLLIQASPTPHPHNCESGTQGSRPSYVSRNHALVFQEVHTSRMGSNLALLTVYKVDVSPALRPSPWSFYIIHCVVDCFLKSSLSKQTTKKCLPRRAGQSRKTENQTDKWLQHKACLVRENIHTEGRWIRYHGNAPAFSDQTRVKHIACFTQAVGLKRKQACKTRSDAILDQNKRAFSTQQQRTALQGQAEIQASIIRKPG